MTNETKQINDNSVEFPQQKGFNWANAPIFIAIVIFTLNNMFDFSLFAIYRKVLVYNFIWHLFQVIILILCPISLIFQLINKNKSEMDKFYIKMNAIVCIMLIVLFIGKFIISIGK